MSTPTEKAKALAADLVEVLRKHGATSVLRHAEAANGSVNLTVEIKAEDPKTLAEEIVTPAVAPEAPAQ